MPTSCNVIEGAVAHVNFVVGIVAGNVVSNGVNLCVWQFYAYTIISYASA